MHLEYTRVNFFLLYSQCSSLLLGDGSLPKKTPKHFSVLKFSLSHTLAFCFIFLPASVCCCSPRSPGCHLPHELFIDAPGDPHQSCLFMSFVFSVNWFEHHTYKCVKTVLNIVLFGYHNLECSLALFSGLLASHFWMCPLLKRFFNLPPKCLLTQLHCPP